MATHRRTVGILGVPFSDGQPKAGTEDGPKCLRDAGVVATLEKLGHNVEDHLDILVDKNLLGKSNCPKTKNNLSVSDVNQKLSQKVAETVAKKQTAVVIGGDHSLGIGSIHGHAKAEPHLVVIWIDAHADINTPNTSTTHNMHGMPLSFLVKELEKEIPGDVMPWCKPCISAKQIVYIGLRDVDPGERKIIEDLGIKSFSMQEVDELGIVETLRQALEHVDPKHKAPIHVSFDIDSVDPQYTPSTGTAVSGGLTLREMFYIAETISKTGRLSVLDVAEVNPRIAEQHAQITVQNTMDVIASFFGRRREGNYIK
ncbi:Arginase, partial [Biomphalaria pfeifferi]